LSGLESPGDASELYLARGDEVVPERPLLTGDVFHSIDVDTGDGAPPAVIIMQHPCAMRRGAALAPRLMVAAVTEYNEVHDWTGNFRVMPLPALYGATTFYAARLDMINQVPSGALDMSLRVASLSSRGINLLQQRFVHYLTRVVVDTPTLNQAMEHVLEEADLLEEWAVRATEGRYPPDKAVEGFERFMREGPPPTRQDQLRDPQQRAVVRKQVRAEAANLFSEPYVGSGV